MAHMLCRLSGSGFLAGGVNVRHPAVSSLASLRLARSGPARCRENEKDAPWGSLCGSRSDECGVCCVCWGVWGAGGRRSSNMAEVRTGITVAIVRSGPGFTSTFNQCARFIQYINNKQAPIPIYTPKTHTQAPCTGEHEGGKHRGECKLSAGRVSATAWRSARAPLACPPPIPAPKVPCFLRSSCAQPWLCSP